MGALAQDSERTLTVHFGPGASMAGQACETSLAALPHDRIESSSVFRPEQGTIEHHAVAASHPSLSCRSTASHNVKMHLQKPRLEAKGSDGWAS